MLVVVELAFAPDEPGRLELRPSHRQTLSGLHERGILRMSGPWDDDSGALLIFETDTEGIKQILAGDPYYSAPGVTVVSVREWNPILGAFSG
ncbi:MAG TPA: YciI family protein [Candidatus Limnocylindrales bacterium]